MRLWIVMAAMAAIVSPAIVTAQDSASGTLRYDDDPALAIAHAVAREYLIPEELRGNPEGNHRLHVILSGAMVPAEAAASESTFLAEVENNGLRGLYLEIDLPERKWSRFSIARPNGEIEGRSFGLDGSELALDDLTIEGDFVSGHARTVLPQKLPDWGDGATRYAFDIRFRAPIARAPVPTERLRGADAQSSPQAAAVIALAGLLASDDLARIRAGLHPNLPFAAALDASDDDARAALADAREFIGSPDEVRAAVEFVLVYGDRAVVVTRTEQGGGRFVVERENGAWVVGAQDQPFR